MSLGIFVVPGSILAAEPFQKNDMTSMKFIAQYHRPTSSKNPYHHGLLRNQTLGLLLMACSLYGIGTFLILFDLLASLIHRRKYSKIRSSISLPQAPQYIGLTNIGEEISYSLDEAKQPIEG